MTSILLWQDIVQISEKICKSYDLKYLDKILPFTHKLAERFGQLDACKPCKEKCLAGEMHESGCKHKVLKIRLNKLGRRKKQALLQKTILDTLAHELAHLQHWYHTKDHKKLTQSIKDAIREMGYDI
jgi:hypothetical protein